LPYQLVKHQVHERRKTRTCKASALLSQLIAPCQSAFIEAREPVYAGDTFTQPMRYSEPGQYVVAYRVISEDGHRIDGSITFTVAEIPAELLDAPAETETSAEAAPSEPEPTTEDETTAASEEDEGSSAALAAGLLLAALVIAVGIAVLVRARRRGAGAE
jgi:copper resistance protein C